MSSNPLALEQSPRLRRSRPPRPSAAPILVFIVVLLFAGSTAAAYEIGVLVGSGHTPQSCYGCGEPWNLGMDAVGSSHPAMNLFEVEISISPTAGLLTKMFALYLTNSTTGRVQDGNSPGSCAGPSGSTFTQFTVASCGAPSAGWYGVLVLPNGTIASVYSSSTNWSGVLIWLSNQMDLYVISSQSQLGATLSAAGIGISVSGECVL
jgi:hypothetical protein